MKEIIYNVGISGTSLTVSTTDSPLFSQYDEVILSTIVSNATGAISVKLHISNPDNKLSPTSSGYNYDHIFYLTPDIDVKNKYSLHLTEALGRNLEVGVSNICNFKFEIINESGNRYNSSNQQIQLYKTNVDISYQPDDITKIFMKLAEIERRLK